jgi:hypothetical protein
MEKFELNTELTCCPQCSSDNISLLESDDNNTGKGLVLFGIPITPPVRTFLCSKCNFTWEERSSLLNIMSLLFIIFFVLLLIILYFES